MLILVYGDDSFRVREKARELQAAFQKKFDPTGLNFASFGADAKSGEILQAAHSLPFMSKKRMVVIRDLIASTKKDGEETWAALAKTPESSIVVLWETADAKTIEKKPLYILLKAGADVHTYPFSVLEGTALSKWTADRVKSRGGQIALDALRELCDRVGGDLWQMDNEIGKLVTYANGRTIGHADVDKLVRATFEGEIFALVDAVSRKQASQAVKLLRQERWSGASDFSIFSMLVRQVRILLGARAILDSEQTTPNPSFERRGNAGGLAQRFAENMGVHAFIAQKALDQARKFSFDDLRTTHDLLFKYDAGMKSGYLDGELAVDLIVAQLASPKPASRDNR